ncbi:MAG: lipoyl(octanoyl) transferase LipB [Flavobacteriales bacterium]|nr:lipoyl(octanoyl) transferase LipB [Flavobacteriales bacterium]
MIKTLFKHQGLSDYQEIWDLQKSLFNELLEDKLNQRKSENHYLISCQHNHVITLGKSGSENNITTKAFPGVTYLKIDRGGDSTYHGPGQLVVYPILDLETYKLGLKDYIFLLEEAVIQTLAKYNIKAGRIKEYTGVWLNEKEASARKIAAIGVKSSRHITMHGLAFNINTDLNYFDLIIPCGIEGKQVTSMNRELNMEIDFDVVSMEFLNTLLKSFTKLI